MLSREAILGMIIGIILYKGYFRDPFPHSLLSSARNYGPIPYGRGGKAASVKASSDILGGQFLGSGA